MRANLYCFCFTIILCTGLFAQDTSLHKAIQIPDKYISSIDKKITGLDDQLTRETDKYLSSLSKQEEKMHRALAKIDSSKAAEVFGDTKKIYEQLSQKLASANGKFDKIASGQYLPNLDSLQGSLGFLKEAKNIISKSKDIQQKLTKSLNEVNQLQNKLNQADEIKAYVQQRQEQLKNLLANYTNLPKSAGKYLGKFQQQAYYYGQQIKEYKEVLNDPEKLLKKVLSTLQTFPAFQKFMSRYSMLNMLFPSPDNYDPTQAVQGLATRQQVMSAIQTQTGTTSANSLSMVQQNVGSAQGQIDQLRNKLIGTGNEDNLAMPDFQPDGMRSRSFLKRLELGTNFQSQRSGNYFPTTSDVGVSVGYKITKKSVIGFGISGKIGWGEGWKHIRITAQGVGLRFFADWKVPPVWGSKEGSLWLTGGAEMNYRGRVESLETFKNYDGWTRSALVGLSKKYTIGKKLKGNISILYDFLHGRNVPVTEPLLFRFGYTF